MDLLHALALVLLATLLPVDSASVESAKNITTPSQVNTSGLDGEENGNVISPLPNNHPGAIQTEGQTPSQKTFVIMHNRVNWETAKKDCERYGMNLATIRNEKEQRTLEQLLKRRGVYKYSDFWLAGHAMWRKPNRSEWVWKIGARDDPLTYTNWLHEGRLHWFGQCIHLRGGQNYKWDEDFCYSHRMFICEHGLSLT